MTLEEKLKELEDQANRHTTRFPFLRLVQTLRLCIEQRDQYRRDFWDDVVPNSVVTDDEDELLNALEGKD